MCSLADEHAIFLLGKAIELQRDPDVLNNLRDALADIVGDSKSEYDLIELEAINEMVDAAETRTARAWPGVREAQSMTISPNTGREIPKRDPKRAADALEHADYQCEYNNSDRTFLRKNGKGYIMFLFLVK